MNRRDAGVAFLRNYFDLACYTHRVASKALYLRFNRARDPKLRKILITELFEEYASAFETLAVLCIALRDREKVDFLTSFMTYKPKKAEVFYARLREGALNFMACLRLPSEETIVARAHNRALSSLYRNGCGILAKSIREIERLFHAADSVTQAIFVKLKHSCVFVDEPGVPDSCVGNPPGTSGAGIGNDRVYVITNPKPSTIPVLIANPEFAHKLSWNTRQLSRTTHEILALATLLADDDLLFVYD